MPKTSISLEKQTLDSPLFALRSICKDITINKQLSTQRIQKTFRVNLYAKILTLQKLT